MASIVVERLLEAFPERDFLKHKTGVVFLYCSYRRHAEQKAANLLSALLKQLVQEQPLIPKPVRQLYDDHAKRGTLPLSDEISTLLLDIIKNFSKVFIVIDALDECRDDDGTRGKLLSEIRNLQAQSDINLMATSRLIPEIKQKFERDICLEVRAIDEDVKQYLDSQMSHLRSFVRENPTLLRLIKTSITKAVDGM